MMADTEARIRAANTDKWLASWKIDTDRRILTPSALGTMYENLEAADRLPDYNQPFSFVSIGSNYPTHEIALWTIDSARRTAANEFISIDRIDLSAPQFAQDVNITTDAHQRHRYIQSDYYFMLSEKVVPPQRPFPFRTGIYEMNDDLHANSVDIFWIYKSVLLSYNSRLTRTFVFDQADYAHDPRICNTMMLLKQACLYYMYDRLKPHGSIIVDMAEEKADEAFDTTVPTNNSSGAVLKRIWPELKLEGLFELQEIGEGNTKLLALVKKESPIFPAAHPTLA